MDTIKAFMMGQQASRSGAKMMVFDWEKAAKLILLNSPKWASAGLQSDWEYTGGTIYEDGQPISDSYTYLMSNWAKPEINMDGQIQECWIYVEDLPEGEHWDSATVWPALALKILRG